MSFTTQRINFIEYGVFNYPKGLEGWRMFRIEYGGHAESCIKECIMWFPPTYNVDILENDLNQCQKDNVSIA